MRMFGRIVGAHAPARKRFLWASCLFVALGLMASRPAWSAPTPIVVGYGFAADFLPAFVAQDKGIFAQNGLKVTLKPFPNTSVVVPALVSGNLQVGISTLPNLLLGAQAGLHLVSIVGAARLEKSNPRISLVTRKGFVVKRASDLIGKKVGILGINSIMDMFFRKWLLDHHVHPNQVTIVETPLLRMGDLLRSGQLDAATPIQPILSRIIASGAGVKSIDYFSEVNPDVVGSVWASTKQWATTHRALVAAFRKSIEEGLKFIRANPAEAKKIEKKYLHVAGKVEPSFSTKVTAHDFDVIIKIGRDLGLITAPINSKALIFAGR